MDYNISTLLTKMGIPELATKKEIKWQYMDMRNEDNGGFAHAEFDAEERFLTISLRHVRTSVSDEIGTIHDRKEETFSLKARRIGDSDTFRITEISFDGEDYAPEDTGMIELGCSIFYARAVEINSIMIDQKFNAALQEQCQDRAEKLRSKFENFQEQNKPADIYGIVVPFKPRKGVPIQRI